MPLRETVRFIDASPSFVFRHRCARLGCRLPDFRSAHGPKAFFTVRPVAMPWQARADRRPFRVVGAHDSPNLRVKQHPDRFVSGWRVVARSPTAGRG
jgi:aspartyl aminopeptidase